MMQATHGNARSQAWHDVIDVVSCEQFILGTLIAMAYVLPLMNELSPASSLLIISCVLT
jgi:hypothetical protein